MILRNKATPIEKNVNSIFQLVDKCATWNWSSKFFPFLKLKTPTQARWLRRNDRSALAQSRL